MRYEIWDYLNDVQNWIDVGKTWPCSVLLGFSKQKKLMDILSLNSCIQHLFP